LLFTKGEILIGEEIIGGGVFFLLVSI